MVVKFGVFGFIRSINKLNGSNYKYGAHTKEKLKVKGISSHDQLHSPMHSPCRGYTGGFFFFFFSSERCESEFYTYVRKNLLK